MYEHITFPEFFIKSVDFFSLFILKHKLWGKKGKNFVSQSFSCDKKEITFMHLNYNINQSDKSKDINLSSKEKRESDAGNKKLIDQSSTHRQFLSSTSASLSSAFMTKTLTSIFGFCVPKI